MLNLKRFSLIVMVAAGVALQSCSDNEPDFMEPQEPDSSEITISAVSNYNSYITPFETCVVTANVTGVSSSGYVITGYNLVVDDDEPIYSDVPVFYLEGADYAHGAHTMTLYAVISDQNGHNAWKPVFENGVFYVFYTIPHIQVGGSLYVRTAMQATDGERLERSFTIDADASGRFIFTKDRFEWTPQVGEVAYYLLNLDFKPRVVEVPEGMEAQLANPQWNIPGSESGSVVKGTVLDVTWFHPIEQSDWLGLTPSYTIIYKGVYEGVELEGRTTSGFIIEMR